MDIIRIFVVLIFIFSLTSLKAQEIEITKAKTYFNLRAIYAFDNEKIYDGFNFSLNYAKNDRVYSISGYYADDSEKENLKSHFWNISALYGISTQTEYFFASLSSGMSLISTKQAKRVNPELDFVEYNDEERVTAGIPIEAQLNFNATKFIGIGLTGFANLNFLNPYYGISLGIQFGKLK